MVGKTIDHNTTVKKQSTGGIGVVLYKTVVVEFFKGSATIVRTGGFYTPTTASRIRACGVNLSIKKGFGWMVDNLFYI